MQNIFLILLFALSSTLYGQNTYTKYRLSNLGSISIPSSMELQAGTYKQLAVSTQQKVADKMGYEVAGDRIVFQPKGLNDFKDEAFSTYARVIVETYYGSYGDYERLTNNFILTSSERKELDDYYRSLMIQMAKGSGLKIVKWNGLNTAKVNGRTAIKVSYLRQLNNNPYVKVDMYIFQNNDRMHQLIVSYRQSETGKWKSLIDKVVDSFEITNVR